MPRHAFTTDEIAFFGEEAIQIDPSKEYSMHSYVKFASVALLASMAALSQASAQGPREHGRGHGGDGKWERLGCEEVGRRPDHDVIEVGRREGRFTAIRLEVQGNSVNILDLKVVYANGAPDDISVRDELREGGSTRPLDLRGRDRAIRAIHVVTKIDREGPGRGRATVCAFGKEA